MFDFVRKHNKLMMGAVFLLIIPSFAFVGLEQYRSFSRDEAVAHVGGTSITRPEWDAAHRSETDRRRQQPNVDVSQLDSEASRYETLEKMVRERVLSVAAAKANLTVPDEQLVRIFAQDPVAMAFRKPDGKVDVEAFSRAMGRSPEQYIAAVRADKVTQQVQEGIFSTALTPPALAAATVNAFYDQREIQVSRFAPDSFASKVTVSDADIETYYKDHTAKFQAPEQASIEYLVYDLEAAKKNIVLSEGDLKTYYEQNVASLSTKEERRASHILIATPSSMSAADREKAKARAEQLLEEVKKAPNTFADVARKNSQDELTAKSGGQLDMGPRGSFVSKPIEDAVFSLKKGEIGNLVQSDFGYHIIQLDEIKPSVVPSFESLRAKLETDVRAQQANDAFVKSAEVFTDAVYQNADSLQPAADKLKLTIQTANDVKRTPVPGANGVLASRNFLTALFTADSLERKQNTEAIDIGSNRLASGRVTKYSPAHPLPLAEVKDKIRAQLVTERAAALAKTDGEAKLAAWNAKPESASFSGAAVTVSRLSPQALPPEVIEGALRADAAKLPALIGVDLGAQGYAVVRVVKNVPRPAPAADVAQRETAQIGMQIAGAEAVAYLELLKTRLKAEILVPKPAAVAPDAIAAR